MEIYMIADMDDEGSIDKPHMATHDLVLAKQWAREVVDSQTDPVTRCAILSITIDNSDGLKRVLGYQTQEFRFDEKGKPRK